VSKQERRLGCRDATPNVDTALLTSVQNTGNLSLQSHSFLCILQSPILFSVQILKDSVFIGNITEGRSLRSVESVDALATE